MSDNIQRVYKTFVDAGRPLKTSEVAQMTGIDEKEVTKIIKTLQNEGKIVSPKRCFYAPK